MSTAPVIIIADPDSMVSSALRVEFSYYGCIVLIASGGREAEEYTSEIQAHMVVVDVSRFKLSGYAACARIRRQPGYSECPIILSANQIEARDRAAAIEAGATALLPKPYSVTRLVNTIRPHLAPDDPLALLLPPPVQGQLDWTNSRDIVRRLGPNSGLRPEAGVLAIVQSKGVRIPLMRIP